METNEFTKGSENGNAVGPESTEVESNALGDAEKEDEPTSSLESLVESLGSFGHWQRVIFFLISIADVWGAFAMFIPIFVMRTPPWSCQVKVNNSSDGNITSELYAEECVINGTVCDSFVFHGSFETIVSKWWLVCDRAYISDLILTGQMIGLLFGAGIFGYVSDWLGRKPSYYISIVIITLPGFLSAFTPVVELYAICRVAVGFGYGSFMVVACVYPLEFVGRRWRTLCGTVGFWAFGSMALVGIGYLLPDWRYLTIVSNLSIILYIPTWWFVPESPRWLLEKGRVEAAHFVLKTIAEKNSKPAPELAVLQRLAKTENPKKKRYSYLHVFKVKVYRTRTFVLIFCWFTAFVVYYQLAYNLGNLHGNFYINMLLGATVDFAAMLFVIAFTNVIGRRLNMMVVSSLAFVANIGILGLYIAGHGEKYTDVILGFALLGKASALAGTYIMQIFTAELFPTAIRNLGVGAGSMAGRVGTIVAPQIVFLGTHYGLIPYLTCGLLTMAMVPLLLLLPETTGLALTDSFH